MTPRIRSTDRNRQATSVIWLGLFAMLTSCSLTSSDDKVISFGIGTQDTTTNTAAAGVVIRELHLLDKYLPKAGAYAGKRIDVTWSNFTSGPPITNGMMADKLQIGVMGDYPLIVNSFTFEGNRDSRSRLIAIAAYNMAGSGNGILVNRISPYYSLADLKGKTVSVPFGSAAQGMVSRALRIAGYGEDFFHLVNQAPEVGSTNLQQQKIDAHADFVPFPELLPHRGFARKIYDGAEAGLPTFHGVTVRTDFAKKYPELVRAYLKAMLDAEAWIKADPKRAAEQIAKWTGTDKEVVYIYLGPGGIMTLDPTIKIPLIAAAREDAKSLQALGKIKSFDAEAWPDDSFLKGVYAERGLDYAAQSRSTNSYEIKGTDDFCRARIANPRQAGEIWLSNGAIKPYSSASCTLAAYADFAARGQSVDVAYVFDAKRGIKLFADEAFFVVASRVATPFMLKEDADAFAARSGGKIMPFADALKALHRAG